jgi:hypothetical protein
MFKWLTGRSGPSRRRPTTRTPTLEELEAAELKRTGVLDRASELPGWALILRSPFESWDGATSWLGGHPRAPESFSWPRNADGVPLHFLAQIDLSALKPEPRTGARPPGLPDAGALLVFAGDVAATRLLSPADVARGRPCDAPDDTPLLEDLGFWGSGVAFPHWPVTPHAYLDTDGGRPPFMAAPFEDPTQWITTCGLAALEAQVVIDGLSRDLRLASEHREMRARTQRQGEKPNARTQKVREKQASHYDLIEAEAPRIIDRLTDWRDRCSAKAGTEPVDVDALARLVAERLRIAERMDSYHVRYQLEGSPADVWTAIQVRHPDIGADQRFDGIPEAFRPFVETMITGWRGHRLFGLQEPPPYNDEDLSGRDCLITIAADEFIATRSEHEHAMSIWCPRDEMAAGDHSGGLFVRHGNG